jgi:hypothetical protein
VQGKRVAREHVRGQCQLKKVVQRQGLDYLHIELDLHIDQMRGGAKYAVPDFELDYTSVHWRAAYLVPVNRHEPMIACGTQYDVTHHLVGVGERMIGLSMKQEIKILAQLSYADRELPVSDPPSSGSDGCNPR